MVRLRALVELPDLELQLAGEIAEAMELLQGRHDEVDGASKGTKRVGCKNMMFLSRWQHAYFKETLTSLMKRVTGPSGIAFPGCGKSTCNQFQDETLNLVGQKKRDKYGLFRSTYEANLIFLLILLVESSSPIKFLSSSSWCRSLFPCSSLHS